MKKRIIIILSASVILGIFSCKKSENVLPNNNPSQNKNNVPEKAKVEDFAVTDEVDDINKVPFVVYSDRDSVTFYTAPKAEAKQMKIKNSKLSNFYGFRDLDGFFELHYLIQHQPNKTIIAYVSKNDFVKDSQLSLKNNNLNEIRSSTVNGVDDFQNKSFEKFGKVSQIDEKTYHQAKSLNEKITPNPNMHFDGKAWQIGNLRVEKTARDEEAEYYHQYTGYTMGIRQEIFMEEDSYSDSKNYTGYAIDSKNEGFYYLGYPAINTTTNTVACVGKNQDVGSDFSLSMYNPNNGEMENKLYVNFTGFSISDSRSLIWVDGKTLYFKANHTNTNTRDPKHIVEYLKIELKD